MKADEEVESAEAPKKALIGLEYEVSGLLNEVFPNKKVSTDAVETQSFIQSARNDKIVQTFKEIDRKPKHPFAGESGILFKNMLDEWNTPIFRNKRKCDLSASTPQTFIRTPQISTSAPQISAPTQHTFSSAI